MRCRSTFALTALLAFGCLAATAERAEANNLFSQFGNPNVQINAGQTATMRVTGQGLAGFGGASLVDLFFDGSDLFESGDIIQFTLGGFTETYDFDNPGNILDLGGSLSGFRIFDRTAGSLLGHQVAGTNYTLSVLAGSISFSGAQMIDDGSNVFAQHGADTLVSVTNTPVPEPGMFVLLGVAAAGAYVFRRRRKAS